MKVYATSVAAALFGASTISAFAPAAFSARSVTRSSNGVFTQSSALSMADDDKIFDQEAYIAESKEMRLKHLEDQAMFALKIACENYGNAVFPNALIAGDVVITHLLHRMGYLKDGKATIMCVDTFHLFPETMEFLREIEDFYGFKAEVFCAEGVPVGDKDAYDKKYGANLWKEDIEQYDKVCKVEPFQRGLKTLNTDCMINGRTRWQGFERAWIDQFENAPIGWVQVFAHEMCQKFVNESVSYLGIFIPRDFVLTLFLYDIINPQIIFCVALQRWIGQVQSSCLLDFGGHLWLHCQVWGSSPSSSRQGIPIYWVSLEHEILNNYWGVVAL